MELCTIVINTFVYRLNALISQSKNSPSITDTLLCNQVMRKNKVITIMLLTMKYEAGGLKRLRERASSVMHA